VQIGVITNPNSKKNRHRHGRVAELERIVGTHGIVSETRSTDELRPILRTFLRNGVEYWVADGGDGTLHWLLNEGHALLSEAEFAGRRGVLPVTVPTNGGTIDFVAKKAGIKGDATTILGDLACLAERDTPPAEVEVDTLCIRMTRVSESGSMETLDRIGFAVAAGGIGQRFFSHYYAAPNPSAGTIAKVFGLGVASVPFLYTPLGRIPGGPAALRRFGELLYRPTPARVIIDGEPLTWEAHTCIHVGSIDINLGGVVRFFPRAAEPGQLHFMVGSPTTGEIIRNIPRMVLGKNMVASELWDGCGRTMEVEATTEELLCPVIDGEFYPRIRSISFALGHTVRLPRVGQRGATLGRMMRLGWRPARKPRAAAVRGPTGTAAVRSEDRWH
jgi:diacylglycerol kinase family enzyme